MKSIIFIGIALFAATTQTTAQDFITRGKIEYEVKINNKRRFAGMDDGRNSYYSNRPEFDVSCRQLVFSGNRWIYQPLDKDKKKEEGNTAYVNLDERMVVAKKGLVEDNYLYKDSLQRIKWKIENETRKIAGFECRKAVGRIYDSVYVVAFYCPEIIPQGGPELFSGLPGMILGMAIPRYFTTWFATRIELADVDESLITAPTLKKGKTYTRKELKEELTKRYKNVSWWQQMTPERLDQYIGGYLL
jgi:GLPGLI family protein